MKRYVLPAALAALVSGGIAAWAVTSPVNPQLCQNPQACVDMNAQFVPMLNSANLLSPATIGVNTFAVLGGTCTAAQRGQMWLNTDATAVPVYNAVATGGGTVTPTLVVCDGVNWRNH